MFISDFAIRRPIIPTVYEIMEEWRSGLLRRFGLRAHGTPGIVPAGADAHADD